MVTLRGIVDSILAKYGYTPMVRDGILEAELDGKRINIAFFEAGSDYPSLASSLSARKGSLILAAVVEVPDDVRSDAERRGFAVQRTALHEVAEEVDAGKIIMQKKVVYTLNI